MGTGDTRPVCVRSDRQHHPLLFGERATATRAAQVWLEEVIKRLPLERRDGYAASPAQFASQNLRRNGPILVRPVLGSPTPTEAESDKRRNSGSCSNGPPPLQGSESGGSEYRHRGKDKDELAHRHKVPECRVSTQSAEQRGRDAPKQQALRSRVEQVGLPTQPGGVREKGAADEPQSTEFAEWHQQSERRKVENEAASSNGRLPG